jgi:S1/P1 Nuclease
MRHSAIAISAAILIYLLPQAAFGWNSTGHRVVALIAYKSLDQLTIEKASGILKDHPAAGSLWVDRDVNSDHDDNANRFLNAATFPDDARQHPSAFESFNRPKNHYVNFKLTRNDGEATLGDAVGDGNLLLSFQQNLELTRNAVAAPDRAVALSWVLHLVGDAHQPLHSVSFFSDAFPNGDEGGNLIKPFPNPRSNFLELHAYWDDLLGSDGTVDQFSELDSIASDIMSNFTKQSFGPEIKRLDIGLWTRDEGGPLAIDVVYGPLFDFLDAQRRITRLPDGYETKAQAAGRRRIALAGYRLAEQLKSLLNPTP